MKTRFIHVGNHKSGSTFIQRELMPRIEGVVPITWELNNNIQNEIDRLILDPPLYCDLDALKQNIHTKLAGMEDICLSFEGFSGFSFGYAPGAQIHYIPERLKKIFGPTRILLVLRGQKGQVQSHYRRLVRFGLSSDFEFWFKACAPPDPRLNFLKYSPLVSQYFKWFGKENVKVLLFAELFNRPKLAEFLEWTGICPDILDGANLSKKINASDTAPILALTRVINTLARTKLSTGINAGYHKKLGLYNAWRYKTAPVLNRMALKMGFRPPELTFDGFHNMLYELCHEDNYRLAQLLGRNDLGDHGFI